MTAMVRESGGTLDKFIGDALMAFWNAPLDVSGHPVLAVETAMAMQEKLQSLNLELREEFGVDIRIGAGIHTGPAYVGNMGSEDLLNYTLIGDSVNLASRLEGLCPQYGVKVVTSSNTMDACGDIFEWLYIDTIQVKGKTQPVSVYSPIRPNEWETRKGELSDWKTACGLYLSANFEESADAFNSLHERFPEVRLYSIYAERAPKLVQNPPENWNGVWKLTSKYPLTSSLPLRESTAL
jgi:adenylate cyclase